MNESPTFCGIHDYVGFHRCPNCPVYAPQSFRVQQEIGWIVASVNVVVELHRRRWLPAWLWRWIATLCISRVDVRIK